MLLKKHEKNKNIVLFYTDKIHKIQKSPVRENKGLFFCPQVKPTSQQVNKPTSFQSPDEAEEFGSALGPFGSALGLFGSERSD